ncbi:phosphatidate cytidylyltransferase [Corynebacterium pacaense]|uniref:phosphatidate cytidylyltransferase n=1 Tax=Corynebacterium pacaense TaxID=1816684 RepID=UPI0009BB522B|nr:phosphatidate cytidylyltransferase [Corynebacterium pacaense]
MSEPGEHIRAMRMPKPRNSAGRNVGAAIGVGIGLGLLVLLGIILSPWGWYLVVAGAVAVATWEVGGRLKEAGYHLPMPIMIIGGQAMVWSSWKFAASGILAAFVATVLVLMFFRIFYNGPDKEARNYLRDTSVGIFVLTWIPLFGSFAAMLSLMANGDIPGTYFIITFMLCVIASDVGGYVSGVFFGSHPMAPLVSPKKSWEGFAGSVVLGTSVGILCVNLLLHHHWWLGGLLGIGLVVCATLGDLVESQFKRDLGIKDMSDLLPGHGGLMDRLDGMLPAAMVTWLVLSAVSSV